MIHFCQNAMFYLLAANRALISAYQTDKLCDQTLSVRERTPLCGPDFRAHLSPIRGYPPSGYLYKTILEPS